MHTKTTREHICFHPLSPSPMTDPQIAPRASTAIWKSFNVLNSRPVTNTMASAPVHQALGQRTARDRSAVLLRMGKIGNCDKVIRVIARKDGRA